MENRPAIWFIKNLNAEILNAESSGLQLLITSKPVKAPLMLNDILKFGSNMGKIQQMAFSQKSCLKTSTNHILPILHQHASVVESGCLRGLWCRPLWFVMNLWLTTNQKYHKGGQLKSRLRQEYENISHAAKRKEMWNGGDAFASFELNLVFKSFCLFVFSSSEHPS